MSKTSTKQSKPTNKAKPTPSKEASANDRARAEALAKLNAPPAPQADRPFRTKLSTTRSACAEPATGSQPKPRAKPRGKDAAKRLSALDAAAQVLRALSPKDARLGLSASELIDRMAAAGLWTSPGGKTPAATLYAAMIREITNKGDASRFVRLEATDGKRGRFIGSPAKASDTRKDQTSKVQTRAQSQKTSTPKPEPRKGAA